MGFCLRHPIYFAHRSAVLFTEATTLLVFHTYFNRCLWPHHSETVTPAYIYHYISYIYQISKRHENYVRWQQGKCRVWVNGFLGFMPRMGAYQVEMDAIRRTRACFHITSGRIYILSGIYRWTDDDFLFFNWNLRSFPWFDPTAIVLKGNICRKHAFAELAEWSLV